MGLLTLVIACASTVETKNLPSSHDLIHALTWDKSAVNCDHFQCPGERQPKLFTTTQVEIREARTSAAGRRVLVAPTGLRNDARSTNTAVVMPL
jgi:hypothetical protein